MGEQPRLAAIGLALRRPSSALFNRAPEVAGQEFVSETLDILPEKVKSDLQKLSDLIQQQNQELAAQRDLILEQAREQDATDRSERLKEISSSISSLIPLVLALIPGVAPAAVTAATAAMLIIQLAIVVRTGGA